MNNTIAIPEELKVEVFKSTIDNAPVIVNQNQKSLQAATAFVDTLLQRSNQGNAMNDPLDKEMNDCQLKLRLTLKTMKERRAPITRIFDEVKSYYTNLENGLKTLDEQVQGVRNQYATEKARIAAEQERARQKKIALDQEKVSLKAGIEMQLKQYFYDYLDARQKELTRFFETITLANYTEAEVSIKRFNALYSKAHFEAFKPVNLSSRYLSADEKIEVYKAAAQGKFEGFCKEFEDTIKGLKELFLDKLPDKKKELEEIARLNQRSEEKGRKAEEMLRKAGTAQEIRDAKAAIEQARDSGFAADALARQADEKLRDELKRLDNEKVTREASLTREAEVTKAAENTVNLFNAMQTAPAVNTDDIKEGYQIRIKNQGGWLPLIAKWFEKEGSSAPMEKIGSMTLNRMKLYCEKLAMTTGEKVVSPFVEYTPVYAAKTKR